MESEKGEMRPKVRMGFVDFWGGYKPFEHFIGKYLSEVYDIEIDNENPDFLFFSCFGLENLKYQNAVKIYYTGENVFPNFNLCDYSISFMRDSVGGRNLYYPSALRYEGEVDLPPVSKDLVNRRFCNFIYSQDNLGAGATYRRQFCKELMRYKAVDCPGKILHNMDAPELSVRYSSDWGASKILFLHKYKFTISFENTDTDGYMTEKLIHPLLAGSVPIYWGSEGNVEPFLKDCMIYAYDYPNMESLIKRIREVDENDELYLTMCEANPLRSHSFSSFKEDFLAFFAKIYERGNKPLSRDPRSIDLSFRLRDNVYIRKAMMLERFVNKHPGLKAALKRVLGRK